MGTLDPTLSRVSIGFLSCTPPVHYARGECDLLLVQLPPDSRCCTSGSGGNLVLAVPARELQARGFFVQPGGGAPQRAQRHPRLKVVVQFAPAAAPRAAAWPELPQWIVDLRRPGAFELLAVRAGAAADTPEEQLQPFFVEAPLAAELRHIVQTGMEMAAAAQVRLAGAGWVAGLGADGRGLGGAGTTGARRRGAGSCPVHATAAPCPAGRCCRRRHPAGER